MSQTNKSKKGKGAAKAAPSTTSATKKTVAKPVEAKINNKIELKAKRLFASYPAVNSLHFTADGQAFFKLNDAKSHASTLSDKVVTPINR